MTDDISWSCCKFSELENHRLYQILRLRSEVFVVEQDCAYQDMDDCDQSALHVSGQLDEKLVCYARLLPPGLKYDGSSIGRVITSLEVRGEGYGKQLITKCIGYCRQRWAGESITISAQHHLENFYSGFGFGTASEPYLEDGIPHIRMRMGK